MNTDNLSHIAERIHRSFEDRSQVRDRVLILARKLTRHAANTIRAIHRGEEALAQDHLKEARAILSEMRSDLAPYPELLYAGYSQDAIKEYVEANITCALILNRPLPEPEELEVDYATYLNGLAEVSGELRRRCLDILRTGYSKEAERLLACMDDIYDVLVTMDYPDAITNGLRRQTDLVRGILERTRGDLTISLGEEKLKESMHALMSHLNGESGSPSA